MYSREDVASGDRTHRHCPGDSRNRGRLVVEWAVVALIAVGLIFSYVSMARGSQTRPTGTVDVRVASGDTLWSLARANPVPGLTTSQTVELIRDLNGIESGVVYAGGRLKVPAAHADATAKVAAR